MKLRSLIMRRLIDNTAKVLSGLAAVIGIWLLIWILWEIMKRGLASINFDFFTHLPTPPGVPGGGVLNAIIGSSFMIMLAALFGVPVGLLAGIYLAEYGRHSKFGLVLRFSTNLIMGMPSIIIGLFVYALLVVPMKRFSGYAGALALAIIMLPCVARTTEDMLSLVPDTLREAALALGAPHWKVTLNILFKAAKAGIITGVALSLARISGETAPLLFTALNSPYLPKSLNQPTANLTVTIFNLALSPYKDWQQLAWGASLFITFMVLLLNISVRTAFRKGVKDHVS